MKKNYLPFILILLVITGCDQTKSNNDLITVDVSANYPEKELILQDFMDVEYIALETTDKFITQGYVKAVGKDVILATNRINDGNIYVFDRKGKGVRVINRFGQGGEEYSRVTNIVLDDENQEMFITDYSARKIVVYDLLGNFRRNFKFVDSCYYNFTFNYDKDHLITYKGYSPIDKEQSSHIIISKQDGEISRDILIPFKELKTPVFIKDDLTVVPHTYLTAPCQDNWILASTSSDTIYNYTPDNRITPFVVRTPSIYSMDIEIYLFPRMLTDRYYFMQTLKKELNMEKMKFPTTDLVYDKQENAIFKYRLFNNDYSDKAQVYWTEPVSQDIVTCHVLDAPTIIEDYEKGRLKGKFKELAATLDEESNPIIMLVKYKK